MGVVINRDGLGDSGVADFCAVEELPILLRIPFGRTIAAGIARGQPLVEIYPEYTARFQELWAWMVEQTGQAERGGA